MTIPAITARHAMPGLLRAQLAIAGIVLLAAVFAPPREGQMVVVPLLPMPFGPTINWVTAHHGRIVGRLNQGPMLMVFGRRADLLGPALAHGALLARLPATLCGTSPKPPSHQTGDLP
jgi:hypothetical protein